MANTAVNNSAISNADDYITLSVTINKNLPATPGDKVASRIFKAKPDELPDIIQLWPKPPVFPIWELIKGDELYSGHAETIKNKFITWDGKEDITIYKPHVNDIVSLADLPDQPKWQVIVKVDRDNPPLVSPWEGKNPAPTNSEKANSTQSISIANAEQRIASSDEDKKTSKNEALPSQKKDPASDDQEEILIRLNVLLTFDIEKYTIFCSSKWPKVIKKTKDDVKKNIYRAIYDKDYDGKSIHQEIPEETVTKYKIYKAISENEEDSIKYFVSNRYMSTPRLPLDEITEGEWLLPVYIVGKSDMRELLTYVKVSITWISDEAKTADKPAKPASTGAEQETTDTEKT